MKGRTIVDSLQQQSFLITYSSFTSHVISKPQQYICFSLPQKITTKGTPHTSTCSQEKKKIQKDLLSVGYFQRRSTFEGRGAQQQALFF